MVAPVKRKALLMVLKGTVALADDSTDIQQLQVDTIADNSPDEVEHYQPLGITSVPAAGADCIVLAAGGGVSNPVVVGVQDRTTRPTGMSEGETKVYSAHGATVYFNASGEVVLENSTGSKTTLKSDGTISVVPSGASVELGADPASGPVALAGTANSRFAVIEALIIAFAAHYSAHIHNGTVKFVTDPVSGSLDQTGPPTTAPYTPVTVPTDVSATKVNAT